MTDAPEKQRLMTLARRLAAATASREADWQAREPDVYIWESSAGSGSVSVASRDRDGEPPFELAVYNPAQERVDELGSALLDDDQPAPWNDALATLYRAARRSALRADDIVEALIDALPAASEEGETEQERAFLRLTRRVAAQGEETE
jgi:hypothetical protein